MSFTFEAKYPGRCGACDGPFGPGDLVTYTDDELVHRTGPAGHLRPPRSSRRHRRRVPILLDHPRRRVPVKTTHALTPRETRSTSGKLRWMVTCSCGWTSGSATCRNERRAHAYGAKYHLDKQHPPCPTPDKRRFKTRDTAAGTPPRNQRGPAEPTSKPAEGHHDRHR